MSGSRKYPAELRERAVRMVAEVRGEYSSEWAAIESVAAKLGIGSAQTLLNWVRLDQIDVGRHPGVTSEMAEELRRPRTNNRELKRANDILKSSSTPFATELDRRNRRSSTTSTSSSTASSRDAAC